MITINRRPHSEHHASTHDYVSPASFEDLYVYLILSMIPDRRRIMLYFQTEEHC